MTTFDACVIALIIVSTLIGCLRGFTRETLSLLSWAGATTSAYMFWPVTRHIARQFITHPMLADAATIVALFIVFLILFSLISYFLTNLVRQSCMGGIDRSLGSFFGLLRGATFVCVFEIVMSLFILRPNHPDWIKNAHCAPLVYNGSDALYKILPTKWQQDIEQQKGKYQESQKPSQNSSTEDTIQKAMSVLEMARLNPKSAPVKEGYSKKQKQDMDRLLDATETD